MRNITLRPVSIVTDVTQRPRKAEDRRKQGGMFMGKGIFATPKQSMRPIGDEDSGASQDQPGPVNEGL